MVKTQRDRKKEDEEYTYELLSKTRPDIFPADFVSCEAPDFQAPDFSVGVELTFFQWEETSSYTTRARENALDKLSRFCTEIAAQRKIRHLGVSVIFPLEKVEGLGNLRSLARRIVDFVEQEIPRPTALRDRLSDFDETPLEDVGIYRISVTYLPQLDMSFWSFPRSGWIPKPLIDDLQRIADSKADRLPLYRTKCLENWLVVVSGGGSFASSVDIEELILEGTVSTNFERLFLFDRPSRSLYEIATTPLGPRVG